MHTKITTHMRVLINYPFTPTHLRALLLRGLACKNMRSILSCIDRVFAIFCTNGILLMLFALCVRLTHILLIQYIFHSDREKASGKVSHHCGCGFEECGVGCELPTTSICLKGLFTIVTCSSG